jgi:predicted acylesterase/phospholipase RssA
MQRKTNIGIVDMLSGKYADFDETKLTNTQDITNVLYASLSTVGFYPPVEAFGSTYIDGAAVWDIDIPSAINTCSSLGYEDHDIVVDVIMTTHKDIPFEDTSSFNSIQMLNRFLHIARYYGTMDGITRATFAYPEVDFRYVVSPTEKLEKNWIPLVRLLLNNNLIRV